MNDSYLLDTSVASVSFYSPDKRYPVVRQKLAQFGGDTLSICVITLGEVEYGLRSKANLESSVLAEVRQAMLQYHVWDIDRHTGDIYGQLRAALFAKYAPKPNRGKQQGRRPEELIDPVTAKTLGIQENDLWIVSVAVQYNLRLISFDKMRRILEVAADVVGYKNRALFF